MRWAHNYSTAELHMLYADKAYQVQAPAVHATILLFFDTADSDRITVRNLLAGIQLNIAEGNSGNAPNTSSSHGCWGNFCSEHK